MSTQHPLMRPLGSENLKPRPLAQAVWEGGKPLPADDLPAVPAAAPAVDPPAPVQEPEPVWQPAEADETCPADECCIPLPPPEEEALPEPEPFIAAEETEELCASFAEETETVSEDLPAPEAEAEPVPPFTTGGGSTLSDMIASILSGAEDDDAEDDPPAVHDAVPDRYIPDPVCVPLYEESAPPRRKARWIWPVLVLLAAAGLWAAWHFGYLSAILP